MFNRLAQLRPGLIIEPGSPASGLQAAAAAAAAATAGKTGSGKTRAAFYLKTTPFTRASRRLCPSIARLRHFCRKPGKLIDMKAIKADAGAKMIGMSEKKVRQLNSFKEKKRVKMSVVVKRLGQDNDEKQEWLVLTPKSKMAKPEKVWHGISTNNFTPMKIVTQESILELYINTQLLQEFFPRPAKRADGSYIYERVAPTIAATNAAIAAAERFAGSSAGGASSAPVSTAGSGAQAPQMLYKKRAYEEKSASSASNEQGIKNQSNFNYVFDTDTIIGDVI